MRRRMFAYFLMVLVALVLLTGCPQIQPNPEGSNGTSLVGSWDGYISSFNPVTGDQYEPAANLAFSLFITSHTAPNFSGIAVLGVTPAAIGYAIDLTGTLINNVLQITIDFSPQVNTLSFTMTGTLSGSTMTGTYLIINTANSSSVTGNWQVSRQL